MRNHLILLICCFLSACASDDSIPKLGCKVLNFNKPLEYTVHHYNAKNRVQSITHYIDILPAVDNILYDVEGTILQVNRLRPNGTPYERHQIIYDPVTKKPAHLSTLGSDLNAAPRITNFYHDDKGRLEKIESPSGSGFVVFRYEYDNNDNIIRKFYTVPGGQEFIGRENHTFDDAPTLYGNVAELQFFEAYIRLIPGSRNNVLTATIHANGPFFRLTSPASIQYEYRYNEQGRVIYGVSSYEDLVGEFEYFEVNYLCD